MKKLTAKEYAIALYRATNGASGKELNAIVEQFAAVLVKNHAVTQGERIIAQFSAYAKKQMGIENIHITTAHKQDATILELIQKAFGEKVETVDEIQPSLLGGFAVRAADRIFDASLKTQLQRLKQSLT